MKATTDGRHIVAQKVGNKTLCIGAWTSPCYGCNSLVI